MKVAAEPPSSSCVCDGDLCPCRAWSKLAHHRSARTKSERKQSGKNQCGARPATSRRIVRESLNLPSRRKSGETTVPVRQRSRGAPLLPELVAVRDPKIAALQPMRWPKALSALGVDVEAAMPGQPARTRARFRISPGNSPSRIAGCHRRHRKSSFDKLESCHVFACNTL